MKERWTRIRAAFIAFSKEQSSKTQLEQQPDWIVYGAAALASVGSTLVAHPIEPGERLQLGGATWTVLRLMHGNLPIVGFRVDYAGRSLAYCTDVSAMPDETLEQLRGLDVLVIDALR